jgi:hypothetical protein
MDDVMKGNPAAEAGLPFSGQERRLMPMPPPPTEEKAGLLHVADEALPGLSPCPQATTVLLRDSPAHANLHPSRQRLRHRLSTYIQMPDIDVTRLASAELAEAHRYRHWRSTVTGSLQVADLQRFVAVATGSDGALRSNQVWIRSHDGCTHLPMVSAADAAGRLVSLVEWLRKGALGSGMLRAVRALALLNNAHPFLDGNGRLGRALFNYCLHESGMPAACYVPLKTLAVVSHGGYEIRLREAELWGCWDGLLSYHCDAIDLYSWLGRLPAGQWPGKEG